MTRYVNILFVVLMVLSAAAVYDLKYEAELASETIRKQETRVSQVREDISLLKAEWALLTRPSRMQDILNKHQDVLGLVPMSSDHIGTLADIPEKGVVPPPDGDKAPGQAQAALGAGSAAPAPADLSEDAADDDAMVR